MTTWRIARLAAAAAAAIVLNSGALAQSFRMPEIRPPQVRVEQPNAELRTARECVEGSDTMGQAATCVSRRLTLAEIEKCKQNKCWGENNTIRQIIEGRYDPTAGVRSTVDRTKDDFNRGDISKATGIKL